MGRANSKAQLQFRAWTHAALQVKDLQLATQALTYVVREWNDQSKRPQQLRQQISSTLFNCAGTMHANDLLSRRSEKESSLEKNAFLVSSTPWRGQATAAIVQTKLTLLAASGMGKTLLQ